MSARMLVPALVGVAGGLALGALRSDRARTRVRARLAAARSDPPPVAPPVARSIRACALVGRALRGAARRPPDPRADARTGAVAVLAVAATLVGGPVIGAAIVALGFVRSVQRRRVEQRQRADAVLDELPEVIDLFRVCFGAGLNVRLAVREVAAHADGILATGLGVVATRAADGERLATLLASPTDVGDATAHDAVRPLLQALLASERDGAPVDAALDRAADEARDRRRRRQEERARRVPVQLVFPLVFCTLPALLALTVAPTLIRSFPSLTP